MIQRTKRLQTKLESRLLKSVEELAFVSGWVPQGRRKDP